jgi:hypothetical protein
VIIQGANEPAKDPAPWWGRVRRTCGQIDGRVDALYPFLFIARGGVSWGDLKARRLPGRDGAFVLAEPADARSATPRAGVILPVAGCRDAVLRTGLSEAARLLAAGPGPGGVAALRERAEAAIQRGGLPARIVKDTLPAGFVELSSLHALFPILHGAFDHVTALWDDPKGAAEIATTAPLPWPRYFDFLEWFYGGDTDAFPLIGFNLMLVYANATRLARWLDTAQERGRQETPGLRPDRFLAIRPDAADAAVTAEIVPEPYGWAVLTVGLDDARQEIDCSEVYPPFDMLVGWLRRVQAGDVPAAVAIDEEGTEKRLTVFATGDPERLWFIIDDHWGRTVFLQAIVNRQALVAAFRRALWAFFTERFDPEQWYEGGGEDEDVAGRILADPLFDDVRDTGKDATP